MQVISAAVAREDFIYDPAAKAAKSLALQAIVDGEELRADFVSLFAARENLTAVFTAYIPGTVNLADGIWTDLLHGEAATLGNASRWQTGEYGGIGFNTFCGEVSLGAYFNPESTGNNYKETATKLDLGTRLLPASDLTVDYLAMYKPVYVYDVMAKDKIARDKDGNKLETYDFDPEATGLHLERTALDQIGWFSSYESSCDGIGYKPWGGAPRGSIHWLYNCNTWYSGNNSNWVGKKWTASGGLNKLDDTLRRNKEIRTYSILLDETLTVDDAGERTTTALFALYRDGIFYNSNEAEEALNSTANGEAKDGYRDIDTPTTGGFWLSATHPTDFFTVRVYNKALTEAEMAHNRTADLLYYYGVEIPYSLYGNDAAMVALAADLASLPFATDAVAFEETKAQIEGKLALLKKPVPVEINGSAAGTLTAIGTTLRLPDGHEEKAILAYRIGDVNYLPNAVVPFVEGMTVSAISITAPVTDPIPTAYVTNKEEELGIRFAASFSAAEYAFLIDTFGENAVRTGILITPRAYVQKANGNFTRAALEAMLVKYKSSSDAAYATVIAPPREGEGDTLYVAGVLRNFKETTLTYNPVFVAVAFIDVDTNGDGVYDTTAYGAYNTKAGGKVKETVSAAREALPARAQGWIDTLLGKFTVK